MIALFQGFISQPRLLPPSGGAAGDDGPFDSEPRVGHDQAAPAARAVYEQLMRLDGRANAAEARTAARIFLDARLQSSAAAPCELPEDPAGSEEWMRAGVARTGQLYQGYLARRKAGGAREYFHCRSHALGVLRAIAPTKLADGAWLHGILSRAGDPRFSELVRTYLEELGDGSPDKNHVLLYRRLLRSHDIDDWQAQPDACFEQGAVQLALAACTDEFLPEVIGFNLGYEQLPLHLLITAYELNELGVDPYYFSLHVTVDNAASGHAMRAVKAVHDAASTSPDAGMFWKRVRSGYKLNDVGVSTTAAIGSFNLHAEFLRVLEQKTVEGKYAHSNYCRIEGRTVNEWLASPDGVQGFVDALERKGWLARGADPRTTRFWQLLHGERAEMFGVFSAYERQLIYDWIRGDQSRDGAAAPALNALDAVPLPPRSFRQQQRAAASIEAGLSQWTQLGPMAVDAELAGVTLRLESMPDPGARMEFLRELMGPARHWTRSGLYATRIFHRAFVGTDAIASQCT